MEPQVFVAGSGECEQLGIPDCFLARRPRALKFTQSIHKLACGSMHTLALTSDGLLFSWGCNDEGALGREGDENLPLHINGLQQITHVSAGDSHTAALSSHLKILYYWGAYRNREGQMTVGTRTPLQIGQFELKRASEISTLVSGANHTLVLADSKVYAWGIAMMDRLDECRGPGKALSIHSKSKVWASRVSSKYLVGNTIHSPRTKRVSF